MKIQIPRFLMATVLTVGLIFVVTTLLAKNNSFSLGSTNTLSYKPSASLLAGDYSTEGATPALAVPILMYHGITVNVDEIGDNTSREKFIAQMEMLKKNGYQTVSIKDYHDFRQGINNLPPKPIIITFDDGRKDSYYPVDEVLKKLGFTATLFVATTKANENDPFYLSWEELKEVQRTGRWVIEAHGRRSHDTVVVDDKNTLGRYLTSRAFSQTNGLESVADYENRVRKDYIEGVSDLKTHLDINSKYYAIPMSDYGLTESNYAESFTFNKFLTAEYFDLAFIQSTSNNNIAVDTFYNYKDTDPHSLRRLEVKNMSAEELLSALLKFTPTIPEINFKSGEASGSDLLLKNLTTEFGNYEIINEGLVLQTNSVETATQIVVGDKGWSNYIFKVDIVKNTTREGWAAIYYSDENNLIKLFWNESKIGLFEKKDGVENVISEKAIPSINRNNFTLSLAIKNDMLAVSIDKYVLTKNYSVKLKRGATALGMWDPDGGVAPVSAFSIQSLD